MIVSLRLHIESILMVLMPMNAGQCMRIFIDAIDTMSRFRGQIGNGWYEDDIDAIQPTDDEIELQVFFNREFKKTLDKVWDRYRSRQKERQDAIEKVKEQKSLCKQY